MEKKEFILAIQQAVKEFDEKLAEKIYSFIDRDDDGRVEFEEFIFSMFRDTHLLETTNLSLIFDYLDE